MGLQNTAETKRDYKIANQMAERKVTESKFQASTELCVKLDSKD